MCGRYSLITPIDKIQEGLDMNLSAPFPLATSYNIAPTQYTGIITNLEPDLLQCFRWGLVPYWAKNENNAARLINARSEGIMDKPSFRMPIRKQRCLVLADSFYEWQRSGGQKYPHRIMLKNDDILVMAGIWEQWQTQGTILKTFSIITAPANNEMSSIHNRMPVILPDRGKQQSWLSDISVNDILDLIQPPVDGLLKQYRVSQAVNKVGNNNASLHKEVNDDLLTLF